MGRSCPFLRWEGVERKMGISRWTYLGPYAELAVTLQTTKRDMCPKPQNCPNPTEGQFCPTCGIQVAKRFHVFQSTDPPFPEFLWKNLNETMMSADGMAGPQRLDDDRVVYRIIANVYREGQPREFHLDEHDDIWMDLSVIDMKAEIAWFRRAFASELSPLQGTYGSFAIKWGLLQWSH